MLDGGVGVIGSEFSEVGFDAFVVFGGDEWHEGLSDEFLEGFSEVSAVGLVGEIDDEFGVVTADEFLLTFDNGTVSFFTALEFAFGPAVFGHVA